MKYKKNTHTIEDFAVVQVLGANMAARQEAAGVTTGGQSQTPLLENKPTTTTNNDGDESDDGVPYDRGWAWMVVAGRCHTAHPLSLCCGGGDKGTAWWWGQGM